MIWFGRSPSYYTASPKTTSEFELYISPKQPPLAVPFELHGTIQPEVWAERILAIAGMGGRYSQPALEGVWIVLSIVATFVVPLILYQSIHDFFALTQQEAFSYQVKARLVQVGVFAGVALVCFSPLIVWKFIGYATMNRMATQWNASDKAASGYSATSCIWKVSSPGILRTQSHLRIAFPRSSSPLMFNSSSLLPSYFKASNDEYFYPYKREPGLPRMSVVGNVPLFLDMKRISTAMKSVVGR